MCRICRIWWEFFAILIKRNGNTVRGELFDCIENNFNILYGRETSYMHDTQHRRRYEIAGTKKPYIDTMTEWCQFRRRKGETIFRSTENMISKSRGDAQHKR